MSITFVNRNESFVCERCGENVPSQIGSCRNHCHSCLWSKHVDVFPGDRSNDCKSLMEPIGIVPTAKKGLIIVHRCTACGEIRKNKTAPDDSFEEVLAVMKSQNAFSV